MKTLNRDKIQRMFGQQAGGAGGSSVNDDGDGVSKLWVEQNYLSKEFFLRLFNIHGEDENDDPVDVQPNDLETTITDIEAMFGFWTEQYLSALGQNSEQGGGGITLNAALASINNSPLGNPTGTSTVLMFNGTTWVYAENGSLSIAQGPGISITTNNGVKTISLTSGVATAGTYKSVTVDTYGRVTAGTNPTTLAGYGITDALDDSTTFWGRTIANGVVKGGIDQASYIEFADIASGTTNGGYIDFHYGGNTTANSGDYTSRIIEDGYDAVNSQGILKINNILWAKLSTGVSIGTSTISSDYKLNVAGYTKTTRLYLAEGVYFEYDNEHDGVRLVNAGFYSDSYVSALGANSGGGGGGSDYIPLTGSDQIAGSLIPGTTNAYDLGDSTHAWRNIRGNSIYASNSLTTYYLTVNSTATVGSLTVSLGDITASAGDFIASSGHGFKVSGKDDTYVLLAGGGTSKLKTVNSYSLFGEGNIDAGGSVVGNYLPLAGGTLTGRLNVYYDTTGYASHAINIKNTSTYNIGSYYQAIDIEMPNLADTRGVTGLLFGKSDSTNGKAWIGYTYSVTSANCLFNLGFYNNDFIVNILGSGNVGIGTKSPSQKLEVNGYALATGYKTPSGTSSQFLKADGSVDDTGYLPLSGGTLSNTSRNILKLDQTGTSPVGAYIEYRTNDSVKVCTGYNSSAGYFIDVYRSDYTFSSFQISLDSITYKSKKVWWEDNDGSGSGLDADLLDGLDSSMFMRDPWNTNIYDSNYTFRTFNTSTEVGIGLRWKGDSHMVFLGRYSDKGYLCWGENLKYFYFYPNGKFEADGFKTRNGTSSQFLKADGSVDSNTYLLSSDISAWAKASTKPTYNLDEVADGTTRKLADYVPIASVNTYALPEPTYNGGTSKDTTSYYMYNDTNETGIGFKRSGTGRFFVGSYNNHGYICSYYDSTIYYVDFYKDKVIIPKDVGINTSSPSYKLDVNGTVGVANTITLTGGTAAKQRIYFDSTHYIELDSNGYFHFSHGVYSDGFVSAMGLNSGGGSAVDYIPLSGSTSITGDLTPSNNNSVSLGSSSKLWAGVYCTNLRAYGTSSISGNLTMAGNITPTVNQQYGLGTSSLKFSSLHVLNSYTYGTLAVNNFTLFEDTYSPAQGVTYSQSHLKSTLNVMYLDCSNGIQSSNTITSRSDIRLKTIQRYIDYLSVDAVASAPIFDYTWNEKPNGNVFVGTSAQYWQQVLPNAVSPMFDRFLSLDYSATALVSAVITARKVVDHEARIRLLEVENAALRNEINQLKKVA